MTKTYSTVSAKNSTAINTSKDPKYTLCGICGTYTQNKGYCSNLNHSSFYNLKILKKKRVNKIGKV